MPTQHHLSAPCSYEHLIINGTTHTLTFIWENGVPQVRAEDIGYILGYTTIKPSIIEFSDDEKVIRTIGIVGDLFEETFLTKKGVYRILVQSRKSGNYSRGCMIDLRRHTHNTSK